MIVWWAKWGKQVSFLQAMQRKGHPVQAMYDQPDLPDYLSISLLCYTDLVQKGEILWGEFVQWVDRYSPGDEEYLWGVLMKARQVLDEWQSTNQQSKAPAPPPGRALK